MTSGRHPSDEAGAVPSVLGLSAATIAVYFGMWAWLGGADGCGPSRSSSSAPVFVAVPFVLPIVAGAILVMLGRGLKWRRGVLVTAVLTAVGIVAVGEVVVFLHEFAIHQCGE